MSVKINPLFTKEEQDMAKGTIAAFLAMIKSSPRIRGVSFDVETDAQAKSLLVSPAVKKTPESNTIRLEIAVEFDYNPLDIRDNGKGLANAIVNMALKRSLLF